MTDIARVKATQVAKAKEVHAPPVTATGGALASQRPLLEGWIPAYGATALLREIEAAIQEAELQLMPITPNALAVAFDNTIALWDDRLPAEWAELAEFYYEALEDMPEDLVHKALKHVRLNHRWQTMPKPADFRSAVADDLVHRRVELWKLKAMRFDALRNPPRPEPALKKTEADRRYAIAELERAKKALGPTEPMHICAVLHARHVQLSDALREATLAKIERSGPLLQGNGSLNGQALAGQEERNDDHHGGKDVATTEATGGVGQSLNPSLA